MSLWRWLAGEAVIANWTPQRAQQAEREMLRREGIVIDPHFLWSKPAKARERMAQMNRERSRKPVLVRANVSPWKVSAQK